MSYVPVEIYYATTGIIISSIIMYVALVIKVLFHVRKYLSYSNVYTKGIYYTKLKNHLSARLMVSGSCTDRHRTRFTQS